MLEGQNCRIAWLAFHISRAISKTNACAWISIIGMARMVNYIEFHIMDTAFDPLEFTLPAYFNSLGSWKRRSCRLVRGLFPLKPP